MSNIFEWHDLCRKVFGSRDDAINDVGAAIESIKQASSAVLNRKLAEGFDMAGEVKVEYVCLVEVLESNEARLTGLHKGDCYLEVRTKCDLRKTP